MSSYYARKFILSDLNLNPELKAAINIAEYSLLHTRNRSYIESITDMGKAMESSQAYLIHARKNVEKMLNLLSEDIANITNLFNKKMALVQELNKFLNTFEGYNSWLYGHFLFDFMAQEHPAEDFNIRLAYDLVRDGKYMKNFTDQFNLHISLYELNKIDSYVRNFTAEVVLYNSSYQKWNETLVELNNNLRNQFQLSSSLMEDIQMKFDVLHVEVKGDERLQDLLGYNDKFDVNFAR